MTIDVDSLVKAARSVSNRNDLERLAHLMRRSSIGFPSPEAGLDAQCYAIYSPESGYWYVDPIDGNVDQRTGIVRGPGRFKTGSGGEWHPHPDEDDDYTIRLYGTLSGAKNAIHKLKSSSSGALQIIRITHTRAVVWEWTL